MKIIIEGKVYDTDTANLVAVDTDSHLEVYRTQRGNWFKRRRRIYSDSFSIDPISETEARALIGLHAPEKYERYFGQAEEA